MRKLIEKMEELGAVKLYAEASGGGDEGCMDVIQLFDAGDNELDEDSDINDMVELMFDEHDYDFSNGDGGNVELSIDLTAKTAQWKNSYYKTELCEDGTEEIEL